MTFTDIYGGKDLDQLNMLLKAQGKNYEFYKDGDEIKFRVIPEERTEYGFQIAKG